MLVTLSTWLVLLAEAYLALGLLFAVPFLLVGIGRIDPVARAGSPGFKLLVAPGVVALWPLLLRRWRAGVGEPPRPRTPHERAAGDAGRAARRHGSAGATAPPSADPRADRSDAGHAP